MYQAVENESSLEICVVLANIGAYDSIAALSQPVTLRLSPKETKTSFLPPGLFHNCPTCGDQWLSPTNHVHTLNVFDLNSQTLNNSSVISVQSNYIRTKWCVLD